MFAHWLSPLQKVFINFYSTYLGLFEEEYLSDNPDVQEAISRSLEFSAGYRFVKNT